MKQQHENIAITAEEFNRFRIRLEFASGILLGDGKEYLVVSRLRKLLGQRNLPNFSELIYSMEHDRQFERQVVDAMTTNETLWFRDAHPYDILRERLFPELSKNAGPIKIWSAACSTGQEPYSIKIQECEYRRQGTARSLSDVQILATDISPSALQLARQGSYPQIAIRRGMPKEHLDTYFDETGLDEWTANSAIRTGIEFREFNLQNSYTSLGKFDLIFCRNVLIYFSAERKRDILIRMHGALKEGGYLILGASEAVNKLQDYYDMVQCQPGIIYRAKSVAAGR